MVFRFVFMQPAWAVFVTFAVEAGGLGAAGAALLLRTVFAPLEEALAAGDGEDGNGGSGGGGGEQLALSSALFSPLRAAIAATASRLRHYTAPPLHPATPGAVGRLYAWTIPLASFGAASGSIMGMATLAASAVPPMSAAPYFLQPSARGTLPLTNTFAALYLRLRLESLLEAGVKSLVHATSGGAREAEGEGEREEGPGGAGGEGALEGPSGAAAALASSRVDYGSRPPPAPPPPTAASSFAASGAGDELALLSKGPDTGPENNTSATAASSASSGSSSNSSSNNPTRISSAVGEPREWHSPLSTAASSIGPPSSAASSVVRLGGGRAAAIWKARAQFLGVKPISPESGLLGVASAALLRERGGTAPGAASGSTGSPLSGPSSRGGTPPVGGGAAAHPRRVGLGSGASVLRSAGSLSVGVGAAGGGGGASAASKMSRLGPPPRGMQ
jgi:hypothetical protein